ncbi:hypothetical protein JHK82_027288 [Glycine max]|nr:hypothetical protein JHK82_027288 [Glycine max]
MYNPMAPSSTYQTQNSHPSPPTMPRAKNSFSFNLDHLSRISYCAMISLVAVFLWMAFTPHFPCFHVTSLNVTSLRTNTGAELTAKFHVEGVLGNPNVVLSVRYESLDLALSFHHDDDDLIISSAPVEPLPFSTGAETDTLVRARFAVTRRLFPRGVVKGITEQRRRGSVLFGVTLLGRVRFTCGSLHTRVHTLKLECYPLKVVFPPNNSTGRLVSTSDCYVV